MLLEWILIKLSSYLKLAMVLPGRKKGEEKEEVGGLTEAIPTSLFCLARPNVCYGISET